MRVTVVHNASAGAGQLPEHHVVHRLEAAGHTVQSATNPDRDLGKRLGKRCDVVVAAGGDGTVLGVARRLVGLGVPLVILPVGTANNVAATVGVSASLDELLAILEHPRERKMDMGVATGSWGERFFSESAGVGWFCDALAQQVVSDADKAPERALRVLADNLATYAPRRWTVTLDGQDVSGSYLLVEVLTPACWGPTFGSPPRQTLSTARSTWPSSAATTGPRS
jgi:diacylglycerol kinase (ATP)